MMLADILGSATIVITQKKTKNLESKQYRTDRELRNEISSYHSKRTIPTASACESL